MTIVDLDIPPGVSSNGTVKVAFVPGGLPDRAAPSLAALTGQGVQDISCHLMANGVGENANEPTTTGRRLCSKQSYTIGGTVEWTLVDLNYVYDVQNPESITHAAYAALAPGSKGDLVIRWGIDAGEDWTEGDVVDIFPVELGVQRKQAPEENSELKVLQTPRVVGDKVTDVALAA